MTAPIELVDTAVAAVQTQAAELGLSWHLHQATVLDGATPSLVKLRMDGDTLASAVTFATSMVGTLVVGARVFVLEVPPAGLYVVGWTGQPALVGASYARKTADETVNNSDVLQDDDELTLAVSANVIYEVAANLVYDSGTTPDIKFAFTFPSGTMTWFGYGLATGVASFAGDVAANAWAAGVSGAAIAYGGGAPADVGARLFGLLEMGSVGGFLTVQWAQNVATASDTIVRASSFLRVARMS